MSSDMKPCAAGWRKCNGPRCTTEYYQRKGERLIGDPQLCSKCRAHRAALVEVARRGCHSFAHGTDSYSDAEVDGVAEAIAAEYLAEQAAKEGL